MSAKPGEVITFRVRNNTSSLGSVLSASGKGKFNRTEYYVFDQTATSMYVAHSVNLPAGIHSVIRDVTFTVDKEAQGIIDVTLEAGSTTITKQVNVIGHPLLNAYINDMCDINGQFRIGRTEVTVAMWREYCVSTNRMMPNTPPWGWKDNHPIISVSWQDIMGDDGKGGYCSWASTSLGISVSLPSEAQWEFAATGGDGRNYPWGGYGPKMRDGTWPGWDKSTYSNRRSTTPVGNIPSGNSPLGCSDMAGNALEWCMDWSSRKQDRKILKGGAWDGNGSDYFRCANRIAYGPDFKNLATGFRLSAGPK
jgi:hypothetical protein